MYTPGSRARFNLLAPLLVFAMAENDFGDVGRYKRPYKRKAKAPLTKREQKARNRSKRAKKARQKSRKSK